MKTTTRHLGSAYRWLPWLLLVFAAAGMFLLGEYQASPPLLVVAGIWLICRWLKRLDVGIMGGAFNPIHNGHLQSADRALEQFGLKTVLFVPSGNPPHKKSGLLDKELRFELVQAGIAEYPRFEASRLEIDRPGVTWTIDTLKELRRRRFWLRRVRLNFIIGEDNIASIQAYDRRDELLSLCRLLVCPRLVPDKKTVEQWRQALPGADLEVVDYEADGISSTMVRLMVAAGKSIRHLVPERVRFIIQSRGLFLNQDQSAEPVKSSDNPAA